VEIDVIIETAIVAPLETHALGERVCRGDRQAPGEPAIQFRLEPVIARGITLKIERLSMPFCLQKPYSGWPLGPEAYDRRGVDVRRYDRVHAMIAKRRPKSRVKLLRKGLLNREIP